MRRFHANPDKTHQVAHASLVVLVMAGAALLIPLLLADGAVSWSAIIGAAVALMFALYTFVRARSAKLLPVAEITDSHFRWRKPGQARFQSIELGDLASMHFSGDQLRLVERTGLYHDISLPELHLREGGFAVNALEAELATRLAR
jgi:hypothetical protein